MTAKAITIRADRSTRPAKSSKSRRLVLEEAYGAVEREKDMFVARNADRCSHLLVRYAPANENDGIRITAAFSLDEVRNWQQVEAVVPLRELDRDDGPDRGLITAFGELEDGISAARIARLFAPLSVAQRMAGGRRD
jgi:hypothetical protein